MAEQTSRSGQADDLRRRAEDKVTSSPESSEVFSREEALNAVHELRVHQIELEMQNEELRRAQAELEVSRARYFDLYDLAPVGYLTLSEKGLILEANLTAAALFGVARGALVDQPLSRYIFPEDQDIYYQHRKHFSETGTPQVCEVRILRADASFWARLDVTAAQDADGAPTCRVVASDITDRKRVEDALQASQQAKYEQVVSMISDVVWRYEIDGQGRFVDSYISPVADRLLGLSAGTICDSFDKYFSYVFPEELPALQETLFSGLCGIAKDGTIEYRLRKPDGTTLWVCSKESAYLQPNGHVVGFGITSDVSERKRAEEQLRNDAAELETTNKSLEQANRLADCANRAKSEFLTNMSHEIRTPMTAILGYANLILDENVGRTVQEYVAVIKRNGEHLLGLIGDILDLSKIEAGMLQNEPTRCSPVLVVNEVVSLMRAQAAAKKLTIKTELAQPVPETVLTDPLRLRQVLVNLLDNAIKFTDQGEIRLAVRLNAANGRLSLCFDVIDTGIGMNEEQVGRLYKPFTQVDNSSTRKFGGTGLGLCISKHLAEALGGTIEVRSEPGRGSTFTVTINPGPLDGIHMVQHAQDPLFNRLSTTIATTDAKIVLHGRILLAEDSAENQQLIALLLRKAGADVVAAENGQLALETALAAYEVGEPFDVILMDMQMPVLDGYEATRQLRKCGYTAPIVALTAHAMAGDCQKCLDAGCSDYLHKPCQNLALLEMVARHIAVAKVERPSLPS